MITDTRPRQVVLRVHKTNVSYRPQRVRVMLGVAMSRWIRGAIWVAVEDPPPDRCECLHELLWIN